MRIVEEVRRIIESMGLPFLYDSSGVANLKLDREEFPLSLMFIFQSWSVDVRVGGFREEYDVMIFFLEKADRLDFDGIPNHTKVERMGNYAINFINEVIKSDVIGFAESEYVEVRSVYDKFDKNLTGVYVETRIKELASSCAPLID